MDENEKKFKKQYYKDCYTENPPDMNYIFFQVQYHDWDSPLSEKINQYRATLIRLLKQNLKINFVEVCGLKTK